MAETLISDIIQPELFLPYVVQRSAQLSAFVASGIIEVDGTFVTLANGGGSHVTMPFWNDLSGNDQVLSDTGALVTKKIAASNDFAIIHNRGDAWSVNDLAKYLSGDDPMGRIGDLLGAYWARKTQDMVINTLEGVFASTALLATNVKDIHAASVGALTAANTLTGTTFLDARALLGDSAEKLTAIAMHSTVYTSLLKNNLITFQPVSEQGAPIGRFMGLSVVVDDSMPVETLGGLAAFHTYLFGQGAIAHGVGTNNDKLEGGAGNSTWQLEFAREALAGQNIMINRRRFIAHPRGIKWLGASMAGVSPTNAELANAANWQKVYDTKNVRLVMIKHNVLG
jgi:Major capsid protein 13-like